MRASGESLFVPVLIPEDMPVFCYNVGNSVLFCGGKSARYVYALADGAFCDMREPISMKFDGWAW